MHKALFLLSAFVVSAFAGSRDAGQTVESMKVQKLRFEYNEMKIVKTGSGMYKQDLHAFERSVDNIYSLVPKVKECKRAVEILDTAILLKKKRTKYVWGQGIVLIGMAFKSYEFGMTTLALSGFSWAMKLKYTFEIQGMMDDAVEAYNNWLLSELGLQSF